MVASFVMDLVADCLLVQELDVNFDPPIRGAPGG